MKLLNKSALYNFYLSLAIVVIAALSFYFVLVRFVNHDATEKIYIEKQRIQHQLPLLDSVPLNSQIFNQDIHFTRLAAGAVVREYMRDTIVYESFDDENIPYRVLHCTAHSRLYSYEVTIGQSLIESNDLMKSIFKALVVLLLLYLVSAFFANRLISKKVLKPFYKTLGRLASFDLQKGNVLRFEKTSTDEFNELNTALTEMTAKIKADYDNLKEFTENASHEIQTPLAIIMSKVELILQSENIDEAQWTHLNSISESALKLSRLNQSLLLLAKIENGQFGQGEQVNFSSVLKNQLDNLSELINSRDIKLYSTIQPNVMIRINPYLLDILVSNLLMNAIRHNLESGFINVRLGNNVLSIQNSGEQLHEDPQALFTRFKKGGTHQDSIGIGLSLVHKIVQAGGMSISYDCHDQVHSILLRF